MRTLHKRLCDLEERKAFQDFVELSRQSKSRSDLELLFFVVHGFFPENAGKELPPAKDFTVGGIRTVVTTERVEGEKTS